MADQPEPQELATIPHTLTNEAPTVKRADQAVWFDHTKGLPLDEKPGWYYASGEKAPDETPLKWYRLKNGQLTVKRPDGGAWFDQTKGLPEGEKPGWYDRTGRLLDPVEKKPALISLPDDKAILEQIVGPEKAASAMKAKTYKPGMIKSSLTDPNGIWAAMGGPVAEITGHGTSQGVTIPGLIHGLGQAGQGIKQAGAHLLGKVGLPKSEVDLVDALTTLRELDYQQNVRLSSDRPDVGRALGEIATAVSPGSLSVRAPAAVAKALPAVGRLGLGIAEGAATGAGYGAIQPVPTPPGTDYEEEQKKNIKQGAKYGALIPSGLAAAKTVTAGGRRIFGTEAERAAALARAEEARKVGLTPKSGVIGEPQEPIPLEMSLGEATRKPILVGIEKSTEYVPFSGRTKQLESAGEGIKARLDEGVKQTQANVDPSNSTGSQMTKDVISKLKETKSKWGRVYDFVRDSVGDTPPPNTEGLKAYDNAIKDASGKSRKAADILREAREEYANPERARTFADLEFIQDSKQYLGNVQPNDPSARILAKYDRDISRGIGRDMHATLNTVDPSGFLSNIYKKTNQRYAKEVFPIDPNQRPRWEGTRLEARLLTGKIGQDQEAITKLLDSKKPGFLDFAYGAMDEKGHRAIEAEIFHRIEQAALKNVKPGVPLSTMKLASAIDRHQEAIQRFVTPENQKLLEGLKNVSREMPRVGQFLESPSTGMHAEIVKPIKGALTGLAGLVPGAATGHSGAVIAGEAGIIGASRLYNLVSGSKAGKDFLLKASSLSPGSPALQKLIQDDLPKVIVTQKSKPSNLKEAMSQESE